MQFALFFRSPPSLCDTSPRRVAELFCPVWGEGFDDLLLKLKWHRLIRVDAILYIVKVEITS
jgi:hypothetical protein